MLTKVASDQGIPIQQFLSKSTGNKSCQKTTQLAGKGDPIWKQFLNIQDEMQNLNLKIAVNDRV